MGNLSNLDPKRVFEIFEEICSVPRGSGDMQKIGDYCLEFADKNGLNAYKDEAGNIVIFKPASKGYENSDTVMLQGHMDIVCQKESGLEFDFKKDGITPRIEGDFIKASGTTLGADNGIAMAMIMAILEDKTICHPDIEAVFTVDEEIGLIGASKIDCSGLKSKKMINIDAEDPKTVTVSCAGGCDVEALIPIKKERKPGKCIKLVVKGLKGGHSGVEIDKGRANANVLAGRILNHLSFEENFEIISVNGGDKGNAITNRCEIEIFADEKITQPLKEYLEQIKCEISDREEGFDWEIEMSGGEFDVIALPETEKIVYMLSQVPDGVIKMSASIEGLVETSLNLGIVSTNDDNIGFHFLLRSNKRTALCALEEKLKTFFSLFGCNTKSYGAYYPWEFKSDSKLQEICKQAYKEKLGFTPEIVAIHAGLECGMFADKINDLDCVAIGPEIIDVHTTGEKLRISSVKDIFECVLEILKKCK
ncbi:MAG: aminoacyl-histidine dipeptidase [Clostridia bacterium]|nr:aminoacyl-histidine dipeptidase [Clostridia bacterium]